MQNEHGLLRLPVEPPTLKFLFADNSNAALARWNRDHLPHREKL